MTFRSTGVRADGDDYVLDGELTLTRRDQERLVRPRARRLRSRRLRRHPHRASPPPAPSTASDFGVDFNAAMETGGVVVGDKVTIQLEIEAVLNS